MRPTLRRLAVVAAGAATAAVVLTGCGADVLDPDDSEEDPSASEATDPAEVEEALPVGETYEGAASTTVETVDRGPGDASWLAAGANFEWLSASVRTCVSAGGSPTEVGWYQWAAEGSDGGWYPADLDYDDAQPTGQYPRLVDLVPGECTEGVVLIAVPRDAELVTLINADQTGTPQGTWAIGDVGAPAGLDG
jgi:hypothetical protein